MSRARVVVTGMGALSALGEGVDALWAGLLAGRSGVRAEPRLAELGLPVTTGGFLPADAPQEGEAVARRAIEAALAQAGLAAAEAGLVWGSGLDTFQTDAGHRPAGRSFAALAARHGPPRRMVAVACASGTQAIGEAARLLRSGRAQACVAGGSSVMLTPFYLVGFHALGAVALDEPGEAPPRPCRPFDAQRGGFALADGAAALVLEPLERALARGAAPLGEVIGFGTSQDAFDLNRPPAEGEGAERCLRRTLADAGLEAAAIDAVNAHATGTLVGDPAEAAALRRVLGPRWTEVPVSGVKGALGHAMAAAGALEAVVALRTCATGVVPPTVHLERPDPACALDHVIGAPRVTEARRVLSCSFGMGGQNAALLLQRWEGA